MNNNHLRLLSAMCAIALLGMGSSAVRAQSMDKANAAIGAAMKANPMVGPALGSLVDFTVHRDYLSRSNAVYK